MILDLQNYMHACTTTFSLAYLAEYGPFSREFSLIWEWDGAKYFDVVPGFTPPS